MGISGKDLIAAISCEYNFYMLRREFGDEVRRDRRRISEGLVEVADQFRNELDGGGADNQLMMVGLVFGGYQPRQWQFVKSMFLESD